MSDIDLLETYGCIVGNYSPEETWLLAGFHPTPDKLREQVRAKYPDRIANLERALAEREAARAAAKRGETA